MSGRDWRRFGRLHTKLYELLGGRFVDRLGLGRRVLLITTTGRKSGLPRTTPLVYMPYRDGAIIYPSNGGKETPPAWWLNLQANPVATIQIRSAHQEVRARAATDAEYAEAWPKAAAYNPHWRQYAESVARDIPLVILEGVDV
jgi:deazaflavin-dependent oxidoreductase (nitroreductase family)